MITRISFKYYPYALSSSNLWNVSWWHAAWVNPSDLFCRYTIDTFTDLGQIAVRDLFSCYFLSLVAHRILVGDRIRPRHGYCNRLCYLVSDVLLSSKEQRQRTAVRMVIWFTKFCINLIFFSLNSRISTMMQYTLSSGLFTWSAVVSSNIILSYADTKLYSACSMSALVSVCPPRDLVLTCMLTMRSSLSIFCCRTPLCFSP